MNSTLPSITKDPDIYVKSGWPAFKGKQLTNASIHRYWLSGHYDGKVREDKKAVSRILDGTPKRCVQCGTTNKANGLRKQPSGLVFCSECRAKLSANIEKKKRTTLQQLLDQLINP